MEAIDTKMASDHASELGQQFALEVSQLRAALSAFPVAFQGVTVQFLSSSAVNHELHRDIVRQLVRMRCSVMTNKSLRSKAGTGAAACKRRACTLK